MRAVVFTSPDQPVEVLDVDIAPPGPGEVKIKIAGAGVCHSDLHLQRGDWPHPAPLVMGHEGSGVVVEVGAGVTNLAEGDHVVISWVAPCGKCRHCLAGREVRCELAANVVLPGGVLFDGTSRLSRNGAAVHHYLGTSSFAEYAIVPASGAIKVRNDAPLDVVALVGCAVATGVGAVKHTKARIVCTRKTTPGLRAFEKHAVRCGGGHNHRFGLDDAILIKDNHIAVSGGVVPALRAAKQFAGHLVKIEIEVDTLDQLDEVLAEGADVVLLDNMTPPQLKEAVSRVKRRLLTEASGGVTLQTVAAIAESGVDMISVGALTHSAIVLDLGLDIEIG